MKVTVKRGLNGSLVNCVVKGNPSPEISWEKCKINETTSCKPIRARIAKEKVQNESHSYTSSILLTTSREHVINCIARNLFGRKKGSYMYKFDSDTTKGNYVLE